MKNFPQSFLPALHPLYNTYNQVIKPLIAEIEARSQNFPLPIFNEIRAFNDHIAQCYLDDVAEEQIDKEIHKAERHIVRIVLDCYKYLIVFLDERIVRFEKQTRHIDLTLIDNGEFYPKYRRLRKECVQKVRNAKRKESQDNGSSIELFEEAYNLYTDLEDLIEEKAQDVNWARKKFKIRKLLKIFLWLTAAILSGFISLSISCARFSEIIKSLLF